MEKLNRFDMVEIVEYGHWLMVHKESGFDIGNYPVIKETETAKYIDTSPELVGQFGIVNKINGDQYSLMGLSKVAWYNREQLKPVLNAKPS